MTDGNNGIPGRILKLLREELIGPSLDEHFCFIEEEEIDENPLRRYTAGVLYPYNIKPHEVTQEADPVFEADLAEPEPEWLDSSPGVQMEDPIIEETVDFDNIGLGKAWYPASLGFSFHVSKRVGHLRAVVSGASYTVTEYEVGQQDGEEVRPDGDVAPVPDEEADHGDRQPKIRKRFKRVPFCHACELRVSEGFTKLDLSIGNPGHATLGLRLVTRVRQSRETEQAWIVTIALVNTSGNESRIPLLSRTVFQTGLECVVPADAMLAYPEDDRNAPGDRDRESNDLLYRDVHYYAIGHGCSVDWEEVDTGFRIHSEFLPVSELKGITHHELDKTGFPMRKLSDLVTEKEYDNAFVGLQVIVDQYRVWIDGLETRCASLSQGRKAVAERHIRECRNSADRIEAGLACLAQDSVARLSFRYMNHAMLEQQYRSNLALRNWRTDGKDQAAQLVLETGKEIADIADIQQCEASSTNARQLGKWRMFQIAFILQCIPGMVDRDSAERDIFDLIWFPTGGGKTEAYLGLAAFTIFFERLSGRVPGPRLLVLMRYTLRLLTAQQFERTAALVLSCERIRELNNMPGPPVSLGMFVGSAATPNTHADAIQKFNIYKHVFVLRKCPWCGAAMGAVPFQGHMTWKGIVSNGNEVRFRCGNPTCNYGSQSMPILVTDEAILSSPADILIATVDKFAMLPMKPEMGRLFGSRDESPSLYPPELVIQDELHLLSGPLGSIVGAYETMLGALYIYSGRHPKCIGSTATISRANEQVQGIFMIPPERVSQFPAPGLDYGDSFFSRTDNAGPGRLYVGVCAHSATSFLDTQIKVFASLIQAPKTASDDPVERDPWMTLIAYFNTLFDLGRSSSLFTQDVRKYLRYLHYRKKLPTQSRRYVNRLRELTSRISGERIPGVFGDLQQRGETAIDACLATSMISVGLDVPRLSLMVMTGQPKTVSEYIQATSRVGRRHPGLVIVLYSNTRSRDISFYEHFHQFHQKPYASVEPATVVPFSVQTQARVLPAVVFGLVRQWIMEVRDRPFAATDRQMEWNRIRDAICRRVEAVDPDQVDSAKKFMESLIGRYQEHVYNLWIDWKDNDTNTVMHTADLDGLGRSGWPVMTSMRNVDKECELQYLANL